MRTLIFWCLLSCAVSAFAADVDLAPDEPAAPTVPTTAAASSVTSAMNDLGFRLLGELSKADGTKNVFISPASIELALAMTYNGANGNTKATMAKSLGYGALAPADINAGNAALLGLLKNPGKNVELSVANSLWANKGLTMAPAFLQTVGAAYDAKLTTLDFTQPASADAVNGWVSEKTKGKIPTLVDAQTLRQQVMLLVNAIYFKGTWTTQFDKNITQDGPFTTAAGAKKTLPMMQQSGQYLYAENERFQAVSLPYGDRRVTLDLYLPREGGDARGFPQDHHRRQRRPVVEAAPPPARHGRHPAFQSRLRNESEVGAAGAGHGHCLLRSGRFPQYDRRQAVRHLRRHSQNGAGSQ